MELDNYFDESTVTIWKERFAIIKAKKPDSDAFANIIDNTETTVILDQTKVKQENIMSIERDWKIFTLNILFSMEVVGVTAKVATALAKEGISIMPIAAYSKDHFLIKDNYLEKAKKVFQELGVEVIENE
ncbi:ACT domain-containing protein [Candidatus Woesearchaeota archaeon]|jgi:uncharacterized protein|nr:ACT domain-containing protein [Candidatus Woesearchaeota archaeon]MBT6519921.1 ACT domain-containing protein [Candidatus Woesearchaeota archaeon]MBT7367103.1 ACT domain-containing protein [Candidatus Woesearchaeota archaeon]